MAREYCRGLTRQQLMDMGIYRIDWDKDSQQWWIDRYWYPNYRNKTKRHIRVKIHIVTAEHKYGKTKRYPKIQINYLGKGYAFPLSRVVYCWFINDIPDGYVIDHIDNDPFNNRLNNLQMLTIEENNRKRFEDLGVTCINQWYNTTK